MRIRSDEREAFTKLARSLQKRPSELLRRLVREAVTGGPDYFADGLHELREAHRQLAAVGRNVNQLLKLANRDEPVVSASLRGELAVVLARVERLSDVYRDAVARTRQRTVKVLREEISGGA